MVPAFLGLAACAWLPPRAALHLHLRQSALILMDVPSDDDNAPSKENDPVATATEAVQQLETIVGSMFTTVKTTSDNWLNSGWSLKKRAGQWVPELRPNSADIAGRTATLPESSSSSQVAPGVTVEVGAVDVDPVDPGQPATVVPPDEDEEAQAAESMAVARQQSTAALSTNQLRNEFLGFLAEKADEGGFKTNWLGEITFESKERLAAVVAQFSFAKLKQLGAAARALARYVDDLEKELEVADEDVVRLRAEANRAQQLAAERDAALDQVSRQAAALRERLADAEHDSQASELARAEAERAAEAAADELATAQERMRQLQADGEEELVSRAEAEKLSIRVEEQLLEAERKALATERKERELAEKLAKLEQDKALAAERSSAATDAVKVPSTTHRVIHVGAGDTEGRPPSQAMEQRALAAEAMADQRADELDRLARQRESTAERLQDALDTLERRIRSAAASDADEGEPGSGTDLITEAIRLRGELRDVLDVDTIERPNDERPVNASATKGSRPPPLSRMRKAELVEECEGVGHALTPPVVLRSPGRHTPSHGPFCSLRYRRGRYGSHPSRAVTNGAQEAPKESICSGS